MGNVLGVTDGVGVEVRVAVLVFVDEGDPEALPVADVDVVAVDCGEELGNDERLAVSVGNELRVAEPDEEALGVGEIVANDVSVADTEALEEVLGEALLLDEVDGIELSVADTEALEEALGDALPLDEVEGIALSVADTEALDEVLG